MKKQFLLIAFVLIFSTVHFTSAQTPSPTPQRSEASIKLESETAKVKSQITKIGRGGDITIVRRDGHEFYGTITKLDDESVTVSEVDLKKSVEIPYQQIKKIYKGYGNRGISGRRIPPKKSLIGLAVVGGILVTVIAIALSGLD